MARERLGSTPGQENLLVRVVIRHPTRSVARAEANALRDRIYDVLHEGDRPRMPPVFVPLAAEARAASNAEPTLERAVFLAISAGRPDERDSGDDDARRRSGEDEDPERNVHRPLFPRSRFETRR